MFYEKERIYKSDLGNHHLEFCVNLTMLARELGIKEKELLDFLDSNTALSIVRKAIKSKLNWCELQPKFAKDIFQEYDIAEVELRNACEYHAMTAEHTEVLGQFLDYSAMDVSQLKRCLTAGYLCGIRNATVFLTQDEFDELLECKKYIDNL